MKDFAIYERRPVSSIVEELVEAFLSRQRKTTKSEAAPVERGDRRQVLVYMSRENIRELKRVALVGGRPAYIIIEELVEAWHFRLDNELRFSASSGGPRFGSEA
ncbi:hypothetical protein [Bradyrhizobium sp.]|uniref:hypothetical protein n=1 Tax=Bradyrhizobium sp. TaxID=376 RepID=UPI003C28C0CF